MHDLTYDLQYLCARNRDGSFATQANRKTMLMQMGNDLVRLGYKQMRATDLKGRHVNKLLAQWQAAGLSGATIRNRLAALRWWAQRVGRASVLPRSNAVYGLAPRQFVAKTSKAKTLPADVLTRIADPYVRMSLELQREYGFRREESLKIRPWQADEGYQVRLQASWCKGGRARVVPIQTVPQRETLDRAKALVPTHDASLIPAHLQYIQQIHKYDYWTKKVGLDHMHGLRHAYAQRRFLEMAGFPAPAAGGPQRAALTPEQRALDEEVRLLISAELGHCREAITAAYLGR